ncbi:hypothetical protein MRB53_038467 [Persea americana]|nr:hypothetical protein MRB53_038467 [Persea americana]
MALLDLPVEIIILIYTFCPDQDVRIGYRVCRLLRLALSDSRLYTATAFYTKKSLKGLHEITKNRHGSHVKHLTIRGDLLLLGRDYERPDTEQSHKAIIHEQDEIQKQKRDTQAFQEFVAACPKLESVTHTIGTRFAYDNHQDLSQLEALAAALAASFVGPTAHRYPSRLKSLTLCSMHPDLLNLSMDENFRAMLKPLHSLRISIDQSEDVYYYPRRGPPGADPTKALLSEATELRELKVSVRDSSTRDTVQEYFGSMHCPHLETLALDGFLTSGSDLRDLLMQHKDTLQRVALSNLEILDGSGTTWDPVLKAIRGMKKLKRIRLRGEFVDQRKTWDFGWFGASDPPKISLQANAMEKFILKGGNWKQVSKSRKGKMRRVKVSDTELANRNTAEDPRDFFDSLFGYWSLESQCAAARNWENECKRTELELFGDREAERAAIAA